MSLPTEQHFILKEDGKIYWITPYPEEAAIEVSNQKELFIELCKEYPMMDRKSVGKVYPLLCGVEKKQASIENLKPLIDFKHEIAVSKGYKLWCELAQNINPYSDEYELLYNEAWERFNSQNKTVALVTFSKPEENDIRGYHEEDDRPKHWIKPEEKEAQDGLKNPLELRDMTNDDLINYIDRLHNDLLNYQLVFDQVARADKHIARNKI